MPQELCGLRREAHFRDNGVVVRIYMQWTMRSPSQLSNAPMQWQSILFRPHQRQRPEPLFNDYRWKNAYRFSILQFL